MSKKATYSAIIEALAKKTGKSKQLSDDFVKSLIDLVKEDLREEGKSAITNFGSFQVKEVAEREGKNPQTGEPITIPAHKRVAFSPYKALKETVNKPYAHLESRLIEDDEDTEKEESVFTEAEDEPETASLKDLEMKEEQEDEKPSESLRKEEPKTASVRPRRPKKKKASPAGFYIILVLILTVVVVGGGYLLSNYYNTGESTAGNELPLTGETDTGDRQEPATEAEAIPEDETIPEMTEEPAEQGMVAEAETEIAEEGPETEPVQAGEDLSETEAEPANERMDETPVLNRGQEGYQPEYRPLSSESYWDIAQKMYGNGILWPLIFAENKTVEDNPDQVFAWRMLNIPEVENPENPGADTYGKLAEATLKVADAYENYGMTEKAEMHRKYAEVYERKAW